MLSGQITVQIQVLPGRRELAAIISWHPPCAGVPPDDAVSQSVSVAVAWIQKHTSVTALHSPPVPLPVIIRPVCDSTTSHKPPSPAIPFRTSYKRSSHSITLPSRTSLLHHLPLPTLTVRSEQPQALPPAHTRISRITTSQNVFSSGEGAELPRGPRQGGKSRLDARSRSYSFANQDRCSSPSTPPLTTSRASPACPRPTPSSASVLSTSF